MPNNLEPEILLCGGGYVLSALAKSLPAGSFIITSRSVDTRSKFAELGYLSESLSIEDPRSIRDLLQKFPSLKTLIDSVPPLVEGRPDAGVRNLSEADHFNRIIYLSTTGVYGESEGEWVSEETLPTPRTESGRKRLVCEEGYLLQNAQTTVLRLSGIYGPGRGLGVLLQEGRYRVLADKERYANRIHVEDIVSVLLHLLEKRQASPSVLNVSDDEPALVSEVVKYYIEKFSLPQPEQISTEEAIQEGRSRLALSHKRVSNALLKESLRLTLRYPTYREGAGTEFLPERF